MKNILFLNALFGLSYLVGLLGGIRLDSRPAPKWRFLGFLAASAWIPLGRLIYGICLIHPVVIWLNLHQQNILQPPDEGGGRAYFHLIQLSLAVHLESALLAAGLISFLQTPTESLVEKLSSRLWPRSEYPVTRVGQRAEPMQQSLSRESEMSRTGVIGPGVIELRNQVNMTVFA